MDYYRFLDDQINEVLGTDLIFNNLLRSEPYKLEPDVMQGFFDRYALIKEFQEITLALFNASLNGEADPEIASLIINELPEHQGWNFHKNLNLKDTPVFFRTDEVVPGKICEIQCPASLWGMCDQLYHFYKYFGFEIKSFNKSLSENFSYDLTLYLGTTPLIHHLIEHSSIPQDVRFFIQQTRKHGLKYFTYDKGVTAYNCNFIRAHISLGHWTENYAGDRWEKYKAGKLKYDLPPTILFDEKMLYMFPFWYKTRHYYSDQIRNMFPYTQLITPDGFEMEDGSKIDIENFCKLSQKQRNYYIKYASSDFLIKWGSKGVYLSSTFSGIRSRQFFENIVKDYHKKRYWIIQQAFLTDDTADYITRDNDIVHANVHSKVSGFYGPAGLMGILMMQRPFYKVHGNEETIVSICN